MGIKFQSICSSSACRTISRVCNNFLRISEYLVIEMKSDSIVFSGVNSLKSAFIGLTLESAFFDSFSWENVDQSQSNYAYCIKVPTKSLSSLFRSASSLKGMPTGSSSKSQESENTSGIASCAILFDADCCKFSISITYAYGLKKVTDVFYEEAEASYPVHKAAGTFEYSVGSPAKTILEWIGCFSGQGRCDEIVFEFDTERASVSIRNNELVDLLQRQTNTSTKLTIKRHQFDEYCIEAGPQALKPTVCISFFEFKVVLIMAACLEADLTIHYDSNVEEPLLFVGDGCLKGTCKLSGIFARNNPDDSIAAMASHFNSEAILSAFPTEQASFHPVQSDNNASDSEEYIPSTPPSKRYACE